MGVICRKPRHRAVVAGGYQWFRVKGAKQFYSGSNFYLFVQEMKINDAMPTAANASGYFSSFVPSNVFDNIFDKTHAWGDSGSSASDSWLAVKLSTAAILQKLSIHNCNGDGVNQPLCFDNFDVSGSNDSTDGANGTWTLLASGLTRSDDDYRWHEWTF